MFVAGAVFHQLRDGSTEADYPDCDVALLDLCAGEGEALLAELKDSTNLMSRNLGRADQLVRSFRQLSARQLSDEYVDCDLVDVIQDCLAGMEPETRKRNLTVTTNWLPPSG